jgi:hypothetical protein
MLHMITERPGGVLRTDIFAGACAAVFQVCPIDVLAAVRMNPPVGEPMPFGTNKTVVHCIEGKGGDGVDAVVVLASMVLYGNMGTDQGGPGATICRW